MKVSLLQQNIDTGLSITSRIVQPTNSLPILGNILVLAKKGMIELQATNLELSIRYSLPAKVEEDGNCSLPARLFFDIVHSLNEDKIQLTSSKDNIILRTDGFEAEMNGLNASEFPQIPEITTKNTITLPLDVFITSVEEILPAVSIDESRPILAGVLINITKKELLLAGTDSYRLAQNNLTINSNEDISVIVPASTLSEVIRVASILSPDEVTMQLSETEIIFELGQAQIISQLIEGQYPDYKKIIPESSSTQVTLEKKELIRAIKIASLFSRENAHSIELVVDAKELVINSKASDIGTNSSKIPAKVSGKPITINVNARYLLDAANAIKKDTLQLSFTDKLEPCVVRPEGKYHSDYVHIIMPLRS